MRLFNAPGAVNGTSSYSLNDSNAVTGRYEDANEAFHGFLLTP
jgi:hypothetical protein